MVLQLQYIMETIRALDCGAELTYAPSVLQIRPYDISVCATVSNHGH